MTQTVPATAQLGPGKTGLAIGYRVLDIARVEYSAFTTTNVAETGTAGTYSVAGGVVAPNAGGYIVWGTAVLDLAEATIDSDVINSVSGSVGSIATDGITAASLAASAVAEIAAAVIAGGAGTYSYSNTVDDGSGYLLDGVFVQCATDTGFTNIVSTATTNSAGAFTVYDDVAGTHYLRLQFSGITFADQTVTLA